jgi:hypothetical protein
MQLLRASPLSPRKRGSAEAFFRPFGGGGWGGVGAEFRMGGGDFPATPSSQISKSINFIETRRILQRQRKFN